VKFTLVLTGVVLFTIALLRSPVGREAAWGGAGRGAHLDLSGAFESLDGRPVTLGAPGKVLFLNVWATWCGPCRIEMPHMAELYREFSGQGLEMVAVSNEDAETVRRFVRQNPYPFTILLDPDNMLAERFGIHGIPTTYILDKTGRLVHEQVGYYRWDSPEMKEQIRELLAQ
jgi:thiol-disulfide isomerase/thioredoxin